MNDSYIITSLFATGIGLISIWIGVSYAIKSKKKRDFEEQVLKLVPEINDIIASLDELFYPDKRVSKKDVQFFLFRHHEAINKVEELCELGDKYEDILRENKFYYFKKIIDQIETRLKNNNYYYDAIQKLRELVPQATSSYSEYTSPHHYFSYSEKEAFMRSLSEIEKNKKDVVELYDGLIDKIALDAVLGKKNTIEQERDSHNKAFVSRELNNCKAYFDTVLGAYPLDPQQRDSIVKLEDNCLVIASAGSGKTSTILGKAKYLVEKRNIRPSKILLITYTRKAATELKERMKIEGITCCTFHSLAYKIISQVTGLAPSICDDSLPLIVFKKLLRDNEEFLNAINNYIVNLQSLMQLEHDYNDSFTYFEDRKKYGIQALFPDVDGNVIFTKSEEEKRLVSLLTKLGITFRYENPYEYNTTTPERRQYKPDFTIYYKDQNGNQKWLYLEHFGIDEYCNVPRWFGQGTKGGWHAANQKYNDGIEWKRETHRNYGTILIETTSADFMNGTVESRLRAQLSQYGVPIKERSDAEIYELLIRRSQKVEKSVYTLILSFITLMKANEKTIDGLLEDLEPKEDRPEMDYSNDQRNLVVLKDIMKPFFDEYQKELGRRNEIDFTDAIIQATTYCRDGLWKEYDYILVDEFQDISVDRYKFLLALRTDQPNKAKTKLYCVGDDWQSIYRFAGSDMSLVYEFEKYFGYTENCKIETTYRFHQPLIDKSSEFIMRNKEQKVKTIKTPNGDTKRTYLNFVKCEGEDGVLTQVRNIINTIPNNQSILLLGRYNYDVKSVGYKARMNMKDDRVKVTISGREIPFLSVHSAKGLEADNVILINCNQGAYGFPSLIEDDPILDFVLSKRESYPFAEERRLFYVAMTRARKNMYVLYEKKKPSPFISEFLLKLEIGSFLCPKCLEGSMVPIKDGVTINGTDYRSFVCSNKEAGCDFFETKYGDLTPPGILITEDMTAQDVEALREGRRKTRGIEDVLGESLFLVV